MIADEPTLRGRTAKRALDYERAIKRFEAALENKLPGAGESREDRHTPPGQRRADDQGTLYLPGCRFGRKLRYAAASGMFEGLTYTCLLGITSFATRVRFAASPYQRWASCSAVQRWTKREIRSDPACSVRQAGLLNWPAYAPATGFIACFGGVTEQQIHDLRLDSSDLPDESHLFQTLPLDEAISEFHGAIGTMVGLNIMRDGWLFSRWVHVTHTTPNTNGVLYEELPGKLGMIRCRVERRIRAESNGSQERPQRGRVRRPSFWIWCIVPAAPRGRNQDSRIVSPGRHAGHQQRAQRGSWPRQPSSLRQTNRRTQRRRAGCAHQRRHG